MNRFMTLPHWEVRGNVWCDKFFPGSKYKPLVQFPVAISSWRSGELIIRSGFYSITLINGDLPDAWENSSLARHAWIFGFVCVGKDQEIKAGNGKDAAVPHSGIPFKLLAWLQETKQDWESSHHDTNSISRSLHEIMITTRSESWYGKNESLI